MARSHCLIAWSVAFAVVAAGNLSAAETRAEKKAAASPVTNLSSRLLTATTHNSSDPFAAERRPAKPLVKPSAKTPPKCAFKARSVRENVAAIEEALTKPTQLSFVDAPLQDVVDYLKEKHEIKIQIDTKALSDIGLDTSTPINVEPDGDFAPLGAGSHASTTEPHLDHQRRGAADHNAGGGG